MATRRSFLGTALAALPALPFLPRALSAAVAMPPAVRRSDPGVPRQVDLRQELHPQFADIEVRLHGKPVHHAVAYDLDADRVVLLLRGLDGRWLREQWAELAPAGVSVHWMRR